MSTSRSCPFEPSPGYVNVKNRQDYLLYFHGVKKEGDGSHKVEDLPTKSLEASTNINDQLYFWQLYSLIGDGPIKELLRDFYERIFSDDEAPWFRDAFVDVRDMEEHIEGQSSYWIDAFGGGKHYPGGNTRVFARHGGNAQDLMNNKGARRWMHHMGGALLAMKEKKRFADDPRILPCIVEFLKSRMISYASRHKWEFDSTDFDELLKKLAEEDK